MAEGEGFEPPEPFPVQWFSRPPPSTTRPSLRVEMSPDFRRLDRDQHIRRACVTGSVTIGTQRDDTGPRDWTIVSLTHQRGPQGVGTISVPVAELMDGSS